MEEIKIRNAKISDIPEINRIYNMAVNLGMATADIFPVNISHHQNWLREHSKEKNPVLIAEIDNKVVGWNSLSYYRFGRPAVSHIRETSYYIDKDYWRKGVATKLMNSIMNLCPQIGVTILITIIIDGNAGSIELMNKLSFDLWGRLPEVVIFDHGKYDHLIFGKKLK